MKPSNSACHLPLATTAPGSTAQHAPAPAPGQWLRLRAALDVRLRAALGFRRNAALGGGVLLGCLMSACATGSIEERPVVTRQGVPVALPNRAEFAEIAAAEERRVTSPDLLAQLTSADAAVRARAAQAIGRMPLDFEGDDATQALIGAMADADAGVRAAAAFAMGLRGDPTATASLARAWNDAESRVRQRVVEAAGRIAEVELGEQVLQALNDPDVNVRLEAIAATAGWDPAAASAPQVDSGLVRVLQPWNRSGARTAPTADERWMTLYALGRRRSERGRAAFLDHLTDTNTNARLFSAMGLARLIPEEQSTRALVGALDDPDWRVVVEALRGLESAADRSSLPKITPLFEHDNAHVRTVTAECLGAFTEESRIAVPALSGALGDRSPAVGAAALISLAKTAEASLVKPKLDRWLRSEDPVLRASVARAASELRTSDAQPYLDELLLDPLPFVANAAIEALGKHPSPENLARLRTELDGQPDLGRRLTAAVVLRDGGLASAADLPHLENAMSDSAGDGASELVWNALKVVAQVEDAEDDVRRLLDRGLRYPSREVRRVATDLWLQRFPDDELPLYDAPPEATRPIPLPGRDYPKWTRAPLVEMSTSRGELLFELLPEEAPVHVFNFVELVERGRYRGTTFHRVVQDFVVQGGDYRGDGNGGLDWREASLRHEFNTKKYLRGALGMPRNEDVDSGGSQIFVTHRPTPHLDGRYTVFGRLVEGFEVLDAIEVGDRILSARVVQQDEGFAPPVR